MINIIFLSCFTYQKSWIFQFATWNMFEGDRGMGCWCFPAGLPQPLPGGSCVDVCSAPVATWGCDVGNPVLFLSQKKGTIQKNSATPCMIVSSFFSGTCFRHLDWRSIIIGNDIPIKHSKYGRCKARISGSRRCCGVRKGWYWAWQVLRSWTDGCLETWCAESYKIKNQGKNGSWTNHKDHIAETTVVVKTRCFWRVQSRSHYTI